MAYFLYLCSVKKDDGIIMDIVQENKQYDEDVYPRSVNESNGYERKALFSKVNRSLSEDELSSPATIRFLLSQFDDFQDLKKQYDKLCQDYHEKDKQCAIYEVRRDKSIAFEILSSAMLAIGPLLLGLFPSILSENNWNFTTIIVLISGVLILLGGIIAKFYVKG